LPQWLVTVSKREALRYRSRTRRVVPFGDLDSCWDGLTVPGPEEDVLRQVPRAAVLRAVAALPARQQALVALLVADPPMGYDEISLALGIPRGSIGPTRSRIFAHLREMLGDQV
jgi:DNA-directed RNA polymerase specialized sigma24 family protein